MKRQKLQNLLMLLLLMVVGAGNVWAQQAASVTQPTADTWVRGNSPASNGGTSETLEMKTYASGPNYFYGLLSFEFTVPQAGYKIKSAKLRVTTRYKKGDSEIDVYPVNFTVNEATTTYATVGTDIEAAMSGSYITTFKLKGDGSKAIHDSGLGDAYKTASAWQNEIDITDHVKSLASNSFTLLFVKPYDQNNSSQIYSREAKSVNLNNDSSTPVAVADLVPQLTVEYEADSDVDTKILTPTIDGWIRDANSASSSNYTNTTLETRYYQSGETTTRFYGVMKFAVPEMRGYEVSDASLRLVTERVKSARPAGVYVLGKELSSGDNYNSIGSYVESALSGSAIGTFTTAGQDNKSIALDNVNESYQAISTWTNNISLSKTAINNGEPLSVVIAPTESNTRTQSTNYFTSEATDYTTKDGVNVTADEIIPQLTIVYKKMDSYELTVTAAEAATLVLPFDVAIPSGVTCYTLNYTAGSSTAKAVEVTGGTLSANTPVLVKASEGNYTFTRTGDIKTAAAVSGALTGAFQKTIVPNTSYILLNGASGVGFYKADGTTNTVKAYRAYLTADGAGARVMIDFDGGSTTAIEQVENQYPSPNTHHPIYNLAGQRVGKSYKGVVIQNGKKYFVK